MKLESLKSQENNQKGCSFKGKSAKIAPAFIQNKPNFKNIKIGISSFDISKYENLPARRSKKQTQNKPNPNPICFYALIGLSSFMTSKYEESEDSAAKKQTQSNPIQTQWDSKMLVLDFRGIQGKLWVTGHPLYTEDIIQLYSKGLLCLELITKLYIQ